MNKIGKVRQEITSLIEEYDEIKDKDLLVSQICQLFKPKLDESRLLIPFELSQIKDKEFIDGRWHYLNPYEIMKAQDSKTAKIIFEEIEKCLMFDKDKDWRGINEYYELECRDWQVIKEKA